MVAKASAVEPVGGDGPVGCHAKTGTGLYSQPVQG